MKAAVLHGPRDIRVEEVETPQVGLGEVLLRVRACGICGSDLHAYKRGQSVISVPAGDGVIMGHEYCGEVAEVGEGVEGLRVGDRITGLSFGGNAEYVKVTSADPFMLSDVCLPMPSNVSFEEAATNEPLATALHAVNLAPPKDEDTVVVIGTGVIGLGIIQILRATSRARIIAVSGSEKRLDMAKELGADVVVNRHREDVLQSMVRLTGSFEHPSVKPFWPIMGVDTVFDCAGYDAGAKGPSPLLQAFFMVKLAGRVIEVAGFEQPLELNMDILVHKEIDLRGSLGYTPLEFRQSFELIRSGRVERRALVTHVFPLSEAREAYETQLNTREAIKVVIAP